MPLNDPVLRRQIARNTFLLAASMAALYGMGQLVLAVSAITFVAVAGKPLFAGAGPAMFMLSGSIAALLGGRAMDRFGRVPVLALGFGVGVLGALITALAVANSSLVLLVLGFILLGAGFGTGFLARVAAADMYVPARRAWGIALVLFGAVFGALLGPLVFMPLYQASATSLPVTPWIAAAGFMFAGLTAVLCVRPDPRRIADMIASPTVSASPTHVAPLKEILRRPGIMAALATSIASYAVMVGMMAMIGYLMAGHGHSHDAVFPVLSAHFLGMFALVLLVGKFIERIGRPQAMMVGLIVLAMAVLSLMAVNSVALNALALFGIGLGWNIAFVAANAELTALTAPSERGRVIGLNDLLAGVSGALITVCAGIVSNQIGLTGLSIGGALLALAPVLGILLALTKTRIAAISRQ